VITSSHNIGLPTSGCLTNEVGEEEVVARNTLNGHDQEMWEFEVVTSVRHRHYFDHALVGAQQIHVTLLAVLVVRTIYSIHLQERRLESAKNS
jgi:hypothetical protein